MSDIVERLREAVDEDCWAAADEIARLRALNEELVGALRDFVAWMDSDEAGPDYGTQTRDTHPDGERIWSRWWADQHRLCDRATTRARAALANARAKGGSDG